ncbi:MAG: V-type ATP synthase subunit A [Deltaproteobacteria bacterium]|nr:MAG: V-type ATP synthase subunit A [Deltaproteobacteria bacterium]
MTESTGKIISISGATVRTDLSGLTLFERVSVGENNLTGEVVRLEKDGTVLQVYEDPSGLGLDEPVQGHGVSLATTLGPGLLSVMFDGLQRPLDALAEKTGSFIHPIHLPSSLDLKKQWSFTPLVNRGDTISGGVKIGYIEEGPFKHPMILPPDRNGSVKDIAQGSITLEESLCRLDDGSEFFGYHSWPMRVPRPYRKKINPQGPVITGQRIIDFLFPLARGGTSIIPGGFGTGKTILEQTIAKHADVDIVIYAGCGERGNEMSELIEEFLELVDPRTNCPLMDRTVLVVNTSNMPVAAREASIYTAVTLGEYYRDLGFHVLLLADSISRWAEALREISSSLEEMPGEEGYPTYLASRLSSFVERAGVVETLSGDIGSLSMILSVSPPGGDFTEPVTQALLRTSGAFLMLDTTLANSRHFPAINWMQSYSLYQNILSDYFKNNISKDWEVLRNLCREIMHKEEALKEIMEIVGIEGLQEQDRLVMTVAEKIRFEFLAQNAYTADAFCDPEKTMELIRSITDQFLRGQERTNATNEK